MSNLKGGGGRAHAVELSFYLAFRELNKKSILYQTDIREWGFAFQPDCQLLKNDGGKTRLITLEANKNVTSDLDV